MHKVMTLGDFKPNVDVTKLYINKRREKGNGESHKACCIWWNGISFQNYTTNSNFLDELKALSPDGLICNPNELTFWMLL